MSRNTLILSDFHVHSDFSSDSQTPMEETIEKAIHLGLRKLCFTDHMDIDYPKTSDGFTFTFDLEDYVSKLSKLKDVYSSKIDILTGIELGLQPHITKEVKELVSSHPFDFILGSSHVVDHIDPYYREYWTNQSEEQGVLRYFESIIENCNLFDEFHVYGHLDYIVRYTPSTNAHKEELKNHPSTFNDRTTNTISLNNSYETYSYGKYADIIDEVLKTILSKGKGIEINSSGYKYGLGHPHPRREILKRYRELGGEIITLGSDAHKPEHLAYDFGKVRDLLTSLGYNYYTTFSQGKPNMVRF